MATPTSAFRLTDRDRRQLDLLADELLLSRTDVIRHGLAALRGDHALRRQILAEQLVLAFLARLRGRYGDHAQIALDVGPDQPEPNPRIGEEPVDPDEAQVEVRHEDDHAFIDLVDPTVGVAIRNAYWTSTDEGVDVRIPLKAIGLYQRVVPTDEPRTHRMDDGRTVVAVPHDDGTVRQFVLDEQGNFALLHHNQHAEWLAGRGLDAASP
jgi:hypothetical protein